MKLGKIGEQPLIMSQYSLLIHVFFSNILSQFKPYVLKVFIFTHVNVHTKNYPQSSAF